MSSPNPLARPIRSILESFCFELAERGIVTDDVTISLPFNAVYALWNELSPMPISEEKTGALELIVHTQRGSVRVRGLS